MKDKAAIAEIEFAPADTLDYEATVTVASNDPASPELEVALAGTGTEPAAAAIALSADAVDFDEVAVDTTATSTLTITNEGVEQADNLIITDVLPAGAFYVGGGMLVGDVVSWTVSSLDAGISTTVQFVVTATETPLLDIAQDRAYPARFVACLAQHEGNILPGRAGCSDDALGHVDCYQVTTLIDTDGDARIVCAAVRGDHVCLETVKWRPAPDNIFPGTGL